MKAFIAFAVIVLACCVAQSEQQSICYKYATIANYTQVQLMTAILSSVITNVSSAGTPTFADFNGSLVNTTDYSNNVTAQNILVAALVAFFGAPSAFNCNATGFPQYNGSTDMKAVHQYLIINNATFEYFNGVVVGVLAGLQVSMADQMTVYNLLESFRSTVCNQPDCMVMTSGPLTTMSNTTLTTGMNMNMTTGMNMNMTTGFTNTTLTTLGLTTNGLTSAVLTTAQAGSGIKVFVSIVALIFAGLIALF